MMGSSAGQLPSAANAAGADKDELREEHGCRLGRYLLIGVLLILIRLMWTATILIALLPAGLIVVLLFAISWCEWARERMRSDDRQT